VNVRKNIICQVFDKGVRRAFVSLRRYFFPRLANFHNLYHKRLWFSVSTTLRE